MALADTARLAVQIDLEGNASAGVAKLNRQVQGLGRSVGRMGRGVGQVGAGFARAGLVVGGAAIAGVTAAAKAAIDFEDAFAGVRKTVNEADLTKVGLSFEGLAKDFRRMATETPLAATEFARLGEIAGALGVKAQDISKFAEVTAKLGVTTNLTADAAADAFGRIGTILNLTGQEYVELADSVVALGNAGASTEAEIVEITKRFAATAKQAGLLKEDMVGLASATASLGFEPERGGSALARVFANMATNISTANAKGKALSRGLGRSVKDLQRDINRGKGLPIFLDILEQIRDMKPTQAARFLKAIGVTNVSDRTIFLAMSQQLPFVNEQLELARKSTGALEAEASKKFATTASKIQIFKNNLIEAGIAMGEQFLPAVGRSLDKLIGALKDPGTKADIVQLGKDIGAAIDDIDWDAVLRGAREFVGVLKGALGFTLQILEAINKLPTEVKAAAAAFLVLDKASGGLIKAGVGNILGGAAQGVLSRTPGIGKLFAQPVFVTNWPPGFGPPGAPPAPPGGPPTKPGGGPPSKPGGGRPGAGGTGGVGIFISDVPALIAWSRETALAIQALPSKLQHGGMSPDERSAAADTKRRLQELAMTTQRQGERTVQTVAQAKAAVDASKALLAQKQAETKRETTRGVTATQAVRTAEITTANRIVAAQQAASGGIIAAIYAARPTINVNNVTKTITNQVRYGPGTGSYGSQSPGSSGGLI